MKSMVQPCLFDGLNDVLPSTDDTYQKAGQAVVRRLYVVRQSLRDDQNPFVEFLNRTIREIKSQTDLTRSQQESLILLAIEKSYCTHSSEIADDTRIPQAIVKTIVKDLVDRGVLYLEPYLVVGSRRKHFLIKSNRIKS